MRNRCIMGLMYDAGLRLGETLAMKPRNVAIEEKSIEVLRGKGFKPRTVYFRCVWRKNEISMSAMV
jgi:site-specific recombinase XerC